VRGHLYRRARVSAIADKKWRNHPLINTREAAFARLDESGKVKQNRLPVPSLLSHQICPWCISTMALAMERPRPMPPCFLVRWDSTW